MIRKRRKKNGILILMLIVLTISIGYAAITTTLSIIGTANIKKSSWNIHWTNVQIEPGSVATTEENKARITDSKSTIVEYSVVLNNPGDYYEFTVDAINEGSLDGMIDSIESKLNDELITSLPSYLKYTVTYDDDSEILKNHKLKSGDTETYKVRIEFRNDENVDPSTFPQTEQVFNFSFNINYKQADSNAIQRVKTQTYYYTGNTEISIDQALPSGLTLRKKYPDAISDFGHDIFSKVVVTNNSVSDLYVGVKWNDVITYFDIRDSYTTNRDKLYAIYEDSNRCKLKSGYLCCSMPDVNNLNVSSLDICLSSNSDYLGVNDKTNGICSLSVTSGKVKTSCNQY